MHYLFVTLILFGLELVYFKLANTYNIIDKPNLRSSHTSITLRGGGIIFPIALLIAFFFGLCQLGSNFGCCFGCGS